MCPNLDRCEARSTRNDLQVPVSKVAREFLRYPDVKDKTMVGSVLLLHDCVCWLSVSLVRGFWLCQSGTGGCGKQQLIARLYCMSPCGVVGCCFITDRHIIHLNTSWHGSAVEI